jgi:AraC family transcriptional regulator
MRPVDSLSPARGETLSSRDLGGLTFAEIAYRPNLKMARHTHRLAHFSLVLCGAYTERFGRWTRAGRASTLVLHPPQNDHEVTFHDARTRIFTVIVKPEWLDRVRDYSEVLDGPRDFSGGPPVHLAARLYHEFRVMDEAAPLMMEGLALEVLAESARKPFAAADGARPRWLARTVELLHERFSEGLTLDEIACAVGVHPVHLSRVFRSKYRCTVGDYVRRMQVDFASRALSASDTPLREIAQAAGFSDQSHFSRAFKRLTGVTPARYRKLHRAR